MLIRSMDGPIRVLMHLSQELRRELDKTARDLQEEFEFDFACKLASRPAGKLEKQ